MNAIMKVTGAGAELSEIEAMIMAEEGEDNNSFTLQPIRAKIAPGGIGQFLLGEDTVKKFSAVVAISQVARGYWPSKESTGAPPICASSDGIRGKFNVDADETQLHDAAAARTPHPAINIMGGGKDVPGSFDCARCPLSQWGSAEQGRGQACKSLRRLLVLPKGWSMPVILTLPPTSNRPWDEYATNRKAAKSSYFAVETLFELDSAKSDGGQTYNFVKVSAAGPLDAETVSAVIAVRHEYRSLVGEMAVVGDDYDTGELPPEYTPTDEGDEDIPFD